MSTASLAKRTTPTRSDSFESAIALVVGQPIAAHTNGIDTWLTPRTSATSQGAATRSVSEPARRTSQRVVGAAVRTAAEAGSNGCVGAISAR